MEMILDSNFAVMENYDLELLNGGGFWSSLLNVGKFVGLTFLTAACAAGTLVCGFGAMECYSTGNPLGIGAGVLLTVGAVACGAGFLWCIDQMKNL